MVFIIQKTDGKKRIRITQKAVTCWLLNYKCIFVTVKNSDSFFFNSSYLSPEKLVKHMKFVRIFVWVFLIGAWGCQPTVDHFIINGSIEGAAGKYVKIIDMTKPGFQPDSIQLDMGGKFTFTQQTSEPKDFIFYFSQPDYIRLVAGVNENISVQSTKNNLLQNLQVSGSHESSLVTTLLKKHEKAVKVIDTLQTFYLKNQMHPNIDSLATRLTFISDSVYQTEKQYLEQFIQANSGTIAAYIALSFKLGYNRNLFNLPGDLKYFEMVDTALMSSYDTITMSKMLNAYLVRAKMQQRQMEQKHHELLIGKLAPEISLPNAWGDTLKLSALTGKYVLVDFWGSWCRPCRKENANLRDAYKKFRYKGFEIYQVAIERNKTDWRNTIREDKLYWKNQVSELNYMESQTAKNYQVKAIPANFLVNPEGIIVAQNLYGEALIQKLDELFNPQVTASN